ncbi:DNA cytosine methyltransferase, partial [Brevibacillus invocatus]|nr:DNA cytosine methyltransferase [Brevibacillus invocatus]
PDSLAVKKGKLLPWRTAAECIDWSIPCPSIFERTKPLADNTCKRIAAGIMRYVINNPSPFIVNDKTPVMTEIANTSSPRCMPANEPLRTICSQIKGGHHALIAPFIAKNYTGVVGSEICGPLHTITACDHNSLVAPTLVVNTSGNPGGCVNSPLKTIT